MSKIAIEWIKKLIKRRNSIKFFRHCRKLWSFFYVFQYGFRETKAEKEILRNSKDKARLGATYLNQK